MWQNTNMPKAANDSHTRIFVINTQALYYNFNPIVAKKLCSSLTIKLIVKLILSHLLFFLQVNLYHLISPQMSAAHPRRARVRNKGMCV